MELEREMLICSIEEMCDLMCGRIEDEEDTLLNEFSYERKDDEYEN